MSIDIIRPKPLFSIVLLPKSFFSSHVSHFVNLSSFPVQKVFIFLQSVSDFVHVPMLLHQARRINRMSHFVLIHCHVTPKSKKTSITVDDTSGVVNVKVTAPPAKGKANKAVLDSLADKLRVSSSKLSIQSGATSRTKVVRFQTDSDPSTFLAQVRYLFTSIFR